MQGAVYAQNFHVTDMGDNVVPNATLVAVDVANVTLPNGDMSELEIGFFSLGAEDATQAFTRSDSVEEPPVDAWMMGGWLYNNSIVESYSYGLHIGSTLFDYPGSLYFGGYDKGRAIGPATTFGTATTSSAGPLQLLDIAIGVETGGSPFSFTSKNELLLDNSSAHNQLPVYPEPMVPCLHLPQQTCDHIVQYLPVSFDVNSGYYLWNTDDPAYTDITTSAAYLGLVFPPGTGDTDNVVIKVPFALLKLNLSSPAISGSNTKTYFPCRAYTPPGSYTGLQGTDNYLLGRAFLQAAFVGRNWRRNFSWLAQAPGPGPSRSGLGSQPLDIADSDTTLDLYTDGNLFNTSWSDYWKPLPGPTPVQLATNASSSSNAASASTASDDETGSSTLSAGAKAGIGIGAAAVGVLALALVSFILIRRRKKESTPSETMPFAFYPHDPKPSPPYQSPDQQTSSMAHQQTAYIPYKGERGYNDHTIALKEMPRGDADGDVELPERRSPTELEAHDEPGTTREGQDSTR